MIKRVLTQVQLAATERTYTYRIESHTPAKEMEENIGMWDGMPQKEAELGATPNNGVQGSLYSCMYGHHTNSSND